MLRGFVFSLLLFFIPGRFGTPSTPSGADGRSELIVTAGSVVFPYRIMSLFSLPGDTIRISVAAAESTAFSTTGGMTAASGDNRWSWTASASPGLYRGVIRSPSDSVVLNLFVMVPEERMEGEYLNGYRIGTYPRKPLKQLAVYKPPRGFVEVTRENEETYVSPHFRLKQFLCKQEGGYPKYVLLREKLLLKLELILERVNEKGIKARSFNILSGYRTPYYNKAIGNVQYSRHIYGGAADIFIDEEPPFDMMDDLNGDGKLDKQDVEVLKSIVEEMFGKSWYEPFIGGLGGYGRTSTHGPFVHVDVRGFKARW